MNSNREFIAAHRARQTERDLTPDSFAPLTSPSKFSSRVDIGQKLLADTLGLTEERLAQLRPKEWQWERDWRTLGGVVFYNFTSLPLLGGMLATRGEPAAALKLMEFLRLRSAPADEFTAGCGGMDGNSSLGCADQTTAAPAQIVPWYRTESGGMS